MSESVSVTRRLTGFCRNEHVELLSGLNNKTAWSKEADLGYGNQVVSVAHDNRTILELVQNARDAIINADSEDDGRVSVIVGPDSLLVANTGSPFRLDDEDVFDAVTSLGRSAKAQDRGSIGEKGVGLKSVLQLSEQFSIYSQVDDRRLSAHFSRSRAARMLLAMYDDLLENPRFIEQLQDGSNNALLEECRSLAGEVDTDVYPEYLDTSQIRAQLLKQDQEPPSPASILGDLPRLSLFRYPFPDGILNGDSPLCSHLIGETGSNFSSSNRFGDDLQTWLETEENTFTTIIELDYVDDEWQTLLDRVESGLDGIDTEALSTFRNNRSSATTDQDEFAKQRQEALWEECTNISPETLILLGQIDQLDLMRVSREEGGNLQMDEYRKITVDHGETTTLPDAPSVSQRPVTYTQADSRDGEPNTHTREFRQYTRTYSDLSRTDEEQETEDDIHLLIEKPQLKTEWQPTSKPLYLYYPIEEVETSFPFAVHAPFRVDFDRQSLAEDDQNQRILEKLPSLVANAATDLTASEFVESGSTTSFAKWMPWLMTPVAPVSSGDNSSQVDDAIKETFDRLRDEPIVPTDTGEPQKPSETLVDPQRLLAFEALRERAANPPLPAVSAVETGLQWRNAVVTDPADFSDWTANIGLTEVLDRPRDNESGRGSIDLLCDHWEASDVSSNEWAISVNDAEYAEQYFETVQGILRSASEDDELDLNDGTIAKKAAKKLGKETVPLLPAEAHQKGGTSETTSVTHLVRARSRSTTSDGGGAARSERIVFRRAAGSGDSDRSNIGNLPTPPDELPVFVIPFRTNWSGALEGYNRDWGTRNLDSPTAFYRRVAAEAGGFSGDPITNAEAIKYIADLYWTVTRNRVAESLRPKPHHHHQFKDVEETIRGAKTNKAPTDYDDFLERRYTQRVQLPVASSGCDVEELTTRPAETLTFGPEWAAEFADAAEVLDSIRTDRYQFDDESREETRVEAFRRWSASIKLASEARCDDSHEIAPPNHDYWGDVFGDISTGAPLDRVRRLDSLIHFGVQVGPRIEWKWSLPQQARRNRTVGAITASEAESLSHGEIPDGRIFAPPATLLEAYQDVVWRSDNDPAFSAGHSKECRKKWLEPTIDEWAGRYGSALIPTWWFFPDFPDPQEETGRRYRDAALLLWPEMDDAIVETAWVCSSQHQFKSPKAEIPSLGVVQLANRELWPAESTSEDGSTDDRLVVSEDECYQARRLLLDERDTPRGAAQYLPRVDIDVLENRLDRASDGIESVEVDISAALQSLGIDRLDNLTPPMAAERLEWFLSQFTVTDSGSSSRMAEVKSSWSARSMSVPVNGLMRQLVADEALSRRFEEREPKRQWIRRDLYNIGTLLPITEGDTSKVLSIGADSPPRTEPDTVVFTDALSKFARARLVNDKQCFVERPAEPAEIANVFGKGDSADEFGIRLRNDPPTPRAVRGAAAKLDDEQLESLRSRLQERHEFLLAACLENTAGINLEETNRKLTAVFENPIGVVQRKGVDSRRNSAEWEASDGTGGPKIALFSDALNRSQDENEDVSEKIPAYLAADGLVQVIGQYDLRDTFEAILFKDATTLESEYRSTLRDVRRDIAELRTRQLERTHEVLSSLATAIADGATFSPPGAFDIDQRTTLETVRTAVNSWNPEDTEKSATEAFDLVTSDNPLLRSWVDELTDSCGLSRQNTMTCLAVATADHEERLSSSLQLHNTGVMDIDVLRDVGEQWRILDVWPENGTTRSVERYATEVDKIQRFFDHLAEHEDEGEDGIHRAINEASSTHKPPSPLTTGGEFVPTPGALAADLRNRRLIEFTSVDREPPALEALAEAVESWVTNECEDLRKSDVIYRDPEVEELFDRLSDAAGEPTTPAGNVQEAFDNFQTQTGRRATSAESSRTDRTADWIAATDDPLQDISKKFVEASASSTTEGGSPDIGESSSGGYDHVNAQIDVRGRDGELICLERAWSRFRRAPIEVRSDILQAVQRWRSYDRWRLKSTDDVAASTSDPALSMVTSGDELTEPLAREDLDGDRTERAAFHALFDTSAERGPGFDLIDPFAMMPDDRSITEWSADWMRRVEAKAVASNRLQKGRIKLTGNELRMALREGPEGEGADARRYLVRLIGFPTDWRDEEIGADDVQLLDIENVVEFAGLDPAATLILEKLRGGSFYVTFSTRN